MVMNMVETPRSSCVASVGYDEGTRNLVVVFKQGGKYSFAGVPKNVYEEMVKASSVGKYFHSRVEKRYPYHKMI